MKKPALILFGSVFVLVFALSDCKKTAKAYTPNCSGNTKSFKNEVQSLVQSSCGGCHSYNTYAQISASASSIRSSIVNGSMPKNSTLSNSQKDIIVCWIDAGAPNN